MGGELVGHFPRFQGGAGTDIHQTANGACLQEVRDVQGGEVDGAGELTEAGSEEGIWVGGVIDGGDVPHQLGDFIDQRREPLGVQVLLPAEAIFGSFDGFACSQVCRSAGARDVI